MKKLQHLIFLATITATGAILPASTASAVGELSFYVPILACRIFDTRREGKTEANPLGTSSPIEARLKLDDTTFFGINNYYTNIFIAAQGGTADFEDKNVCDIPPEAVAININLTATSIRGARGGFLRAWPYDGTLPDNEDGSTATVVSWGGSQLGNAFPLSINSSGTGFNFTVKAYFKTPPQPTPPVLPVPGYTVHIIGDVLGYYLPVGN